MPIVCPIRRRRRSITVTCLLEAQHPVGNVLLVEVVIPQRTAGSEATGLDTTMLVLTGSRERTESEYQDPLHRAGLTLVRTAPTASQLSILQATPAQDEQR
jgi:O-methyltransferase domain